MTDPQLSDERARIDRIDDQIFALFNERLEVATRIGEKKRSSGRRVYDRKREDEKFERAAAAVDTRDRGYAYMLQSLLMEAARGRQHLAERSDSPVAAQIARELGRQRPLFPQRAEIACQGVEGAYSQVAAERIFKHPRIAYFNSFGAVFSAVEQGLCSYGILPIENSTAGSVNQVFDLMKEHDFYIVRTCRIKVDHALLARPGTHLEDVRVVYSHPQAISQCSNYIAGLPDVRVHTCENTAIASQRVAEGGTEGAAAIANLSCAELYGLEVLDEDIQDRDNNYTRFAAIAKDLAIYPGADRSSLQIVARHEPGALYKVLAKFYSLDLNIIKLESRPIANRDFQFMFYFDVECPVAAPEFMELMETIGDVVHEVRYLGSYSEVV